MMDASRLTRREYLTIRARAHAIKGMHGGVFTVDDVRRAVDRELEAQAQEHPEWDMDEVASLSYWWIEYGGRDQH